MTKTHTLPAGTMDKIGNTTNYTCPMDVLETFMEGAAPELHAEVLSSLAWMVDSSAISQARNCLFERFAEAEGMAFDEFTISIAADMQHESLYEHEGAEQTLAQLMSIGNQWHDAAASAASANGKDYKCKSMRELLADEKVKVVDSGVLKNFQLMAEAEAAGDKPKAERMLASYLLAHKLGEEERVRKAKELAPVLLEILRGASRHALESYRFENLPTSRQKQLVLFAGKTIERAMPKLAVRMSKTPIAFGRTAEAARSAGIALTKLASSYEDAGALENCGSQVEIDIGRNAKRVARSLD